MTGDVRVGLARSGRCGPIPAPAPNHQIRSAGSTLVEPPFVLLRIDAVQMRVGREHVELEGSGGRHTSMVLCQIESLSAIDAEIAGGAADILLSEQFLTGCQILGLSVNDAGFRAATRVGGIAASVEPGIASPFFGEAALLNAGDGLAASILAQVGEKIVACEFVTFGNPNDQSRSSFFLEDKLRLGPGLALTSLAFFDHFAIVVGDVFDPEHQQVRCTQHRVDRGIEQSQVTRLVCEHMPDHDDRIRREQQEWQTCAFEWEPEGNGCRKFGEHAGWT